MPHTHTRAFRVRYYECDAHGHLNNANYLRYMQETAFDASAAAGYDLERYESMGYLWLIRQSGVEYLRPLHYNDEVQVKTWVADFYQASSRRAYEFRMAITGELVAHAYTDWVFLDTQRWMPSRIPPEMHTAFFPEGLPQSFPKREPFPQSPPPPPGIYIMRHKVAWGDIDSLQHVNNAVYMNYITECGMQALEACGWPWKRWQAAGLGLYLRSSQVRYLQPALLDDGLEIVAWASDVRRATLDRHYTVHRASDGILLCQATTHSVCVDIHTNQPRRLPKDFLADFAPNITAFSSRRLASP